MIENEDGKSVEQEKMSETDFWQAKMNWLTLGNGKVSRAADGGVIYHVSNRGNARMPILVKDGDFEAFERKLEEAVERFGTDLLAWGLMSNHWHLVVKPPSDAELSRFVGWFTLNHSRRWHAHYGDTRSGHVYQGRFRSFPFQEEYHFLAEEQNRFLTPFLAQSRRGHGLMANLCVLCASVFQILLPGLKNGNRHSVATGKPAQ